MRPIHRFACCSILCLGSAPALGQNVITYNVEPQIAEKALKVRMDIPRVRELTVRVQMPVPHLRRNRPPHYLFYPGGETPWAPRDAIL